MKWIPCEERLPEDSGDYLVCPSDSVLEDYSDFSEVMIMPYDADCEEFGWWTDRYDPISFGYVDSDFNEFEVLAWMPLPKPYEAEQTEPNCSEKPNNSIPHDDYIESENDHLEARCLNCNNAKACKEKHWKGCVYEPKDEKTCESCRHWKYIAREWQCEACKCQGYEPTDEPQTEVKGSERLLKGKTEPQTEEWYTLQDEQEYNARHGKE